MDLGLAIGLIILALVVGTGLGVLLMGRLWAASDEVERRTKQYYGEGAPTIE